MQAAMARLMTQYHTVISINVHSKTEHMELLIVEMPQINMVPCSQLCSKSCKSSTFWTLNKILNITFDYFWPTNIPKLEA